MNFIKQLKNNLNNDFNRSVTENGAIGYRTTGKSLLDLNFAVASLRNASESEIIQRFMKAYFEDRKTALIWLFYARDIRGGLGERRLFRTILKYLSLHNQELPFKELLPLIPVYGRYDDLFCLLESDYRSAVIAYIDWQLKEDLKHMEEEKPVSLLAKWLPGINTSSEVTKALDKTIARELHMSQPLYRKTLSKLRKYLDVVEVKMSAGQFEDIQYESVPSKANLIYKNAFMAHDEVRRSIFLADVVKGKAKINSSVLFPHEIVSCYMKENLVYDETLEQLWKSLPDTAADCGNTLVVADGSGSMRVCIDNSGSTTALSVANALAIYFAERCKGAFQNTYITFSTNPQLVDLSKGSSLKEKLQIAGAHSEVANTDIYKVFQLILNTAVKNKMSQKDIPENIVIISDMEFDSCAVNAKANLFQEIDRLYRTHGYKLPRLIFWNVNARTNTIPVKENQLGVALVSGFSIQIADMVMSTQVDPYNCLLEILADERYDALRNVI
jgi:hypothetical protein